MTDVRRHDTIADPASGATTPPERVSKPRVGGRESTDDERMTWEGRTRVVLTPIAAPSIMGLMGFFIATVMVGAWQAGWYGSSDTPFILWPFAMVAGGILQSIAAIFSFRARDGAAVAIHTAWGSFWIAWGILQLLTQLGVDSPAAPGQVNTAFAFWFIALAMVTLSCAFAAVGENLGNFLVLCALFVGSAFTAAGFWSGASWLVRIGGWAFVVSAGFAWLAATAMILENAYGRVVLPLGEWKKNSNVPGRAATHPLQYKDGMPGAKVGQ